MKTPREILLARHRSVEGRLDQIRQDIVGEVAKQATPSGARAAGREASSPAFVALKLWRELVQPSRGFWASLAIVWLVILGFHLGAGNDSNAAPRGRTPGGQELRAALEQRREWIAEFALLPVAEAVEPSKTRFQPRSERRDASSRV